VIAWYLETDSGERVTGGSFATSIFPGVCNELALDFVLPRRNPQEPLGEFTEDSLGCRKLDVGVDMPIDVRLLLINGLYARVAPMMAGHELLHELETCLTIRSTPELSQMLQSVTHLFLHEANQLAAEQVGLFDDVLCRLVEHVETEALAQLSTDLAKVETAPPQVVRRLARHDEIAVCGPVLRDSKLLQTSDLVEIAATRSQAHLLAIGSRSSIEEAVTDVLVERGDIEVARIIAGNGAARFSEPGLRKLVTRAQNEDGLIELVAIRREISPPQLRQLIAKATERVRRKLIAAAGPQLRSRIDAVLQGIASGFEGLRASEVRNYSLAEQAGEHMRHPKAPMWRSLQQAAQDGDLESCVSILAGLANLATFRIQRLLTNDDPGGMLLLCKVLDVPWSAVRLLLLARPARKQGTSLQLDSWCEQYAKINKGTAMQVVGFWQSRGVVTDAATTPHGTRQSADCSTCLDWSDWTVH
jgi:hypothetical protein